MPTSTRHPPLDTASRARLFLQLAQLEKAGFPADQAFAMMAKNDRTPLRKRLHTLPARLRAGQSVAEAGFNAGLFDANLKTLVAAAESGGTLAGLYRKLAVYYRDAAKRQRQTRSRLYLPAVTLTIALFVQPLPALVTGKISGGAYLWDSAGQLSIMALGIALLLKLPRLLAAFGLSPVFHHGQLAFAPVANWVVDRQLNAFFFMLAMLLDAGLPFAAALSASVASISNTALRKHFAPALALMETGASVAETLATVPVLKATTLHIINSGEHSGQLPATVLHFTLIDAQALALQDDALAEWLPRLAYTAIGLWMAYGVLAQNLPKWA
jgi:general secretion pathway protein F